MNDVEVVSKGPRLAVGLRVAIYPVPGVAPATGFQPTVTVPRPVCSRTDRSAVGRENIGTSSAAVPAATIE